MLWFVWYYDDVSATDINLVVSADNFDEAIKKARDVDERFCCAKLMKEVE